CGIGQYLRGQTEHVLLCTTGPTRMSPPLTPPVTTLVGAARGEHSEKPELALAGIERVSPGPRAELFCRTPRVGWYSWGNDPALAAAAQVAAHVEAST